MSTLKALSALQFTIAAIAVLFVSVGCAPKQDILLDRVTRLERELDDVRIVQAELSAKFDALEGQARQVTGKMEELAFSQQSNRLQGDVGTLKQEISRLGRRIPPPALVPLLALEEDEARVGSYSSEESRFFNNGLTRIRTGSYHEAQPVFQELYQLTGNPDLQARAMFWMGVSEEGKGNNPAALKIFHDLVQNHPSHPRVPHSLLRQASVLVRLRDTNTARLTLQKLIASYPDTPEANDARARLARLG
jgi:TolA-binding protein